MFFLYLLVCSGRRKGKMPSEPRLANPPIHFDVIDDHHDLRTPCILLFTSLRSIISTFDSLSLRRASRSISPLRICCIESIPHTPYLPLFPISSKPHESTPFGRCPTPYRHRCERSASIAIDWNHQGDPLKPFPSPLPPPSPVPCITLLSLSSPRSPVRSRVFPL